MKKIVFSLILCLFIVGCGRDYETYTKAEKRKMYDIALEEQDKGNDEKINKIYELMDKLKIAYENGDSIAKKEYIEWHNEQIRYRSNTNKLINSKVDMSNRAW